MTDDELASYKPIDFDLDEYRKDVGVEKLLHEDKAQLLMHRWRFPSLSLHGIEGKMIKLIVPLIVWEYTLFGSARKTLW